MPGKASSKSAGKFKASGGPKGGMAGFKGVGTQKPGVTATTMSDNGKFAKGGSGKMAGFSPVKTQKSGRSSVS